MRVPARNVPPVRINSSYPAMDYSTVDPAIQPYYDTTFVMCGLIFCDDCGCEPSYSSAHAEYSDGNYFDQAVAMHAGGWVLLPKPYRSICSACASKRGRAG